MLCFTARLRLGTYDAAMIDDALSPEWPPHPARLFCALVAGDPTAAEWDALRWLEVQPPPEVHASDPVARLSPQQFLVTNRTEGDGGSQVHPGRRQTVRVKPRLMPAERRFHIVWPAAEPPAEHRASLAALARRVPYVGRVTSDAEVVVAVHFEAEGSLQVYEPVDLRDAEVDLRVPYPGYADRLSGAFNDGRRAWEESRRTGYRKRVPAVAPPDQITASPFSSLMVFAIEGRSHLEASHTAKVTDQLRRAVIRLVEDDRAEVLPAISGHDANNRGHVAYLGVPNVGTPELLPGADRTFVAKNTFADGRLLGVALAIPRDGLRETSYLHRALVKSATPLDHLTLGSSGVVGLHYMAGAGGPYALAPVRWAKPSRWWATATPIVLDRFPKPGHDVTALVADAIVTAGYPRPDAVHVSRSALLPGSPMLGQSTVQRRAGLPLRPWFHAWVRFESPLGGPLIAGSMRYRGLGLFAPLEPTMADVKQ